MQFGFKKATGCAHAIYTAQTTIEYFTSNNSTVNLCSLDLSKAFDKVNHHLLFIKLIERNVPVNFIKLLECWYDKSFSSIKWQNNLSKPFKLMAGVRQGGVLSPVLFAIYVNDLLLKLNSCKFGCHINHTCFNATMYADDLLLLSLSINDLQNLIDLCVVEFDKIDMQLNINKSCCMRIGKRRSLVVVNLLANGMALKWCDEIRYLGSNFLSANSLKCNLQSNRQKFIRALNSIYGKIGTKTDICVLLNLLDSFCVPLLTYNSEAIKLLTKDYKYLESTFSLAFAKTFGSYHIDTIRCCQYFSGCLPIWYRIDCRKIQFLMKIRKSKNSILSAIFDRCGAYEMSDLLSKYGLSVSPSQNKLYHCMWAHFENSLSSLNL